MIRSAAHSLVVLSLLAMACSAGTSGDAASRAVADSSLAARADSVTRARRDSLNRARPGYIVDSILPIAEEVRRFRASIGGLPVSALAGGAPTRDALVGRFAAAVGARDSAALRSLAITPREFIDLVYPFSPYIEPPYRQAPGLLWSQIQLPSGTGFARLLDRLGGKPLRIAALNCPVQPEHQGDNLLHQDCTVRFASGDAPLRYGRLFGTILERRGHFKFVGFANMY